MVFSDLFWAASPRCWTVLPIKLPRGKFFARTLGSRYASGSCAAQLLPRGGVFRLVLGSSAAVLDFDAH